MKTLEIKSHATNRANLNRIEIKRAGTIVAHFSAWEWSDARVLPDGRIEVTYRDEASLGRTRTRLITHSFYDANGLKMTLIPDVIAELFQAMSGTYSATK